MEALLEAGEEGGLAQRGDQLVTMVALQYRLLTNKHLGDDTLARADVVTLYLRISQLLSKVGAPIRTPLLASAFPAVASLLGAFSPIPIVGDILLSRS